MGRWGTRTYVNHYVTHIIGVSLGHSANCAYFICFYTLVLYASILYICVARLTRAEKFNNRNRPKNYKSRHYTWIKDGKTYKDGSHLKQ